MDGVIMNGKVLKVKQYNLEFGGHDRFVNILGCFKYKTNGNVYIIYSDTDPKYNIIYYGSGHIRENIVLCMQCRDKSEEEIIKEYIFKIIQKESLDNFEMLSLESAEAIEIIASAKLDVKPEILTNLIDIVMPKPVIKEEPTIITKDNKPKTKTSKTTLILIMIIAILAIGVYFFLGTTPKDTTEKSITCTKKYPHDTLTATIDETNKYNFNINDKLESVDNTIIYQFNETNYQDFIMRGTYYRYMPSSDTEGGWDKNDDEYWFKVTTKNRVDTSYSEPTNYEEVLSYYKAKEYTCKEEIINE